MIHVISFSLFFHKQIKPNIFSVKATLSSRTSFNIFLFLLFLTVFLGPQVWEPWMMQWKDWMLPLCVVMWLSWVPLSHMGSLCFLLTCRSCSSFAMRGSVRYLTSVPSYWHRCCAAWVPPSPPAVSARHGLSGPAIPLSSLRGAQALPKSIIFTCPLGVQPHVRDPLRPLQIQQCLRCRRFAATSGGGSSPHTCQQQRPLWAPQAFSFKGAALPLPRASLCRRPEFDPGKLQHCSQVYSQCGVSPGGDFYEESNDIRGPWFPWKPQHSCGSGS